ncbi:hypothetical protein Tco_0625190 [Tanacetum coccineum]|uniref:Uncharacterized protein n=1 Tax=Tanacetum coccineum TaxID=301880 RepID=A0ABQ4WG29_9ASTR
MPNPPTISRPTMSGDPCRRFWKENQQMETHAWSTSNTLYSLGLMSSRLKRKEENGGAKTSAVADNISPGFITSTYTITSQDSIVCISYSSHSRSEAYLVSSKVLLSQRLCVDSRNLHIVLTVQLKIVGLQYWRGFWIWGQMDVSGGRILLVVVHIGAILLSCLSAVEQGVREVFCLARLGVVHGQLADVEVCWWSDLYGGEGGCVGGGVLEYLMGGKVVRREGLVGIMGWRWFDVDCEGHVGVKVGCWNKVEGVWFTLIDVDLNGQRQEGFKDFCCDKDGNIR